MSTSHDWARDLQRTAEFLLSKPEVDLSGDIPRSRARYWGGEDKVNFLKFVRAAVPGRKVIGEYSVEFRPTGANLEIAISRETVCRKVQDVKYECEPLLSPEEDAELEAPIPIDAPLAQAIRHDQQLERSEESDAANNPF